MTDRADGRRQQAGITGSIELAHEASTSGSGGVPATRAGIARMIRVPHRVERPRRARPRDAASGPRAHQPIGVDDPGLAGVDGCAASRPVSRDRRRGRKRPPILGPVKLVVAIVHSEDAGHLVDGLLEREFRATRLHSSGGFLKQSNATVILGVEDDQVDAALAVIRENCHSRTQLVNPMPPIMEPGEFFLPYPLEVEVGGATVFVLPVERVERI